MKKSKKMPTTALQEECHIIAELGDEIETLHKTGKFFVDPDNSRRIRENQTISILPRLHPVARALSSKLLALLGSNKTWQIISDSDVELLIAVSREYRGILQNIYTKTTVTISSLPLEFRNGHFVPLLRSELSRRPRMNQHRLSRKTMRK